MEKQLEGLYYCLDIAGYKPGNLKMTIIALLGMIGESGEVVEEFLKKYHSADIQNHYVSRNLHEFVKESKRADDLKKMLRDNESVFHMIPPTFEYNSFKQEELDAEIADQLYYLIALIKIQDKPVSHYVQLAINKFISRTKNK